MLSKIDNIELYRKILDLQSEVIELHSNLIEKDTLIREKEKQISKLKKAMQLKEKVIRIEDSYFELDNKGRPIGDPYCSHFMEVENLAVHLHRNPRSVPGYGGFCPACQNNVHVYLRITSENQKNFIEEK